MGGYSLLPSKIELIHSHILRGALTDAAVDVDNNALFCVGIGCHRCCWLQYPTEKYWELTFVVRVLRRCNTEVACNVKRRRDEKTAELKLPVHTRTFFFRARLWQKSTRKSTFYMIPLRCWSCKPWSPNQHNMRALNDSLSSRKIRRKWKGNKIRGLYVFRHKLQLFRLQNERRGKIDSWSLNFSHKNLISFLCAGSVFFSHIFNARRRERFSLCVATTSQSLCTSESHLLLKRLLYRWGTWKSMKLSPMTLKAIEERGHLEPFKRGVGEIFTFLWTVWL